LRIAVLTQYVHDAGGVEAYLASVLPALAAAGHDLALWYQFAAPPERTPYPGSDVRCRLLSEDRLDASIGDLGDWKPDVMFLNGLSKPDVEMRLTERTPTVTFLHSYHGTCISGAKVRMLPTPSPCHRRLGPGCLMQYYPRRCGGLNPLVMAESYKQQRIRQRLLQRSAFVATFSEHMRREAISNGVAEARAVHLPAFNPAARTVTVDGDSIRPPRSGERLHIGFIGRMERLKGAHVLMDALAHLDPGMRSRLKVTFAGDGRDKPSLERAASHLADLDASFPGWVGPCERERLLSSLDLLVVPSIWPEPFGLVGIEAAAAGVPAVAFDVGGISDWLEDNCTGRLVPAPPSSAALASALADSLSDAERLKRWGGQARARAHRLTLETHVSALEEVFRRAIISHCPLQ
jgi:glycosyltransferase involved in cell wall biosynthesis